MQLKTKENVTKKTFQHTFLPSNFYVVQGRIFTVCAVYTFLYAIICMKRQKIIC